MVAPFVRITRFLRYILEYICYVSLVNKENSIYMMFKTPHIQLKWS